jgi:hypothetical protein
MIASQKTGMDVTAFVPPRVDALGRTCHRLLSTEARCEIPGKVDARSSAVIRWHSRKIVVSAL